MALKAVLDSLDGLSDVVKAEYTDAGDGTFRLNVEGADALVDTSGLKKTVKKLRDENASLSAWAKAFPDKTPEEIAELVRLADAKPGDGKPDLDKLRKDVEVDLTKKFKPIETERDEAKKELRTLRMADTLRTLALKAGVFEDGRLTDAVNTALEDCDLDDKNKIIVLEDGEISAKTPEQYFNEILKAKKPWLYKAPEASGGDRGTSTKRQANTTGTVKTKADLKTDKDKSTYISKNGHKAYIDLPSE